MLTILYLLQFEHIVLIRNSITVNHSRRDGVPNIYYRRILSSQLQALSLITSLWVATFYQPNHNRKFKPWDVVLIGRYILHRQVIYIQRTRNDSRQFITPYHFFSILTNKQTTSNYQFKLCTYLVSKQNIVLTWVPVNKQTNKIKPDTIAIPGITTVWLFSSNIAKSSLNSYQTF